MGLAISSLLVLGWTATAGYYVVQTYREWSASPASARSGTLWSLLYLPWSTGSQTKPSTVSHSYQHSQPSIQRSPSFRPPKKQGAHGSRSILSGGPDEQGENFLRLDPVSEDDEDMSSVSEADTAPETRSGISSMESNERRKRDFMARQKTRRGGKRYKSTEQSTNANPSCMDDVEAATERTGCLNIFLPILCFAIVTCAIITGSIVGTGTHKNSNRNSGNTSTQTEQSVYTAPEAAPTTVPTVMSVPTASPSLHLEPPATAPRRSSESPSVSDSPPPPTLFPKMPGHPLDPPPDINVDIYLDAIDLLPEVDDPGERSDARLPEDVTTSLFVPSTNSGDEKSKNAQRGNGAPRDDASGT
jgi:hypothetical protein